MVNRIDATFAALRQKKQKAFITFITAGDPSFEVTRELVLGFAQNGVDIIELGIPFSDPIADGPVIQASYTRALAHGATLQKAFHTVREIRQTSQIPLLFMISYTLVYRHGLCKFVTMAQEAGVDGAIIPDLPIEEGAAAARIGQERQFDMVFLVAPTTTAERRRRIAQLSQGFIYCVSVTGITGERDRMPEYIVEYVRAIKSITQKPVCVGFGVSTPEQAHIIAQHADGVIVGSAIVRQIERHRTLPPAELVGRAVDFVRPLISATKGR